MTTSTHDGAQKRDWRDSLAAWVAVCALLVFLLLVILMVTRSGISDTAWSRLVYLLTGVEAVAFAGAGWVFGKEVHRTEVQRVEDQVQAEKQRATRAEDSARQATSEARQAAEAADAERLRGARIAQAAVTASTQQRQSVHRGEEHEISADGGLASPLDPVAELARQLYPELTL